MSIFLQNVKNYFRIFRLLLINEYRNLAFSVNSNDICFDFGANVGDITLLFWFRGARVIALEPSPRAFNILSKRCGHLKNICLFNKAISNTNGTLPLYISNNIQSSSLCSDKANVSENSIFVESINIPSLLKLLNLDPTFVKCDIEGGEYIIYKDLIELAAMPTTRKILVECHAKKHPGWIDSHNSFVSEISACSLNNIDLTWH